MPLSNRLRPAAPGLVLAALVLGLEALGLLVLAVIQLAQMAGSPSIAVAGLAFAGCSALLLVVARGVLRGRRWSRAPAVVTQLIQLPIAWTLRDVAPIGVSAALALTAALVLIGLLVPSSTAAFLAPKPDGAPRARD